MKDIPVAQTRTVELVGETFSQALGLEPGTPAFCAEAIANIFAEHFCTQCYK